MPKSWFQVVLFTLLLLVGRTAVAETWQRDPLLSQLLVKQMVTDEVGYRWVATDEGVFRYDGYELVPLQKLVRRGDVQPPRLHTPAIVLDHAQRLWIGAESGLYCFERLTGQLRMIRLPHTHAPLPDVRVLFCHPRSGHLWVSYEDNQIVVLDPQHADRLLGPPRALETGAYFFQADDTPAGVWISGWHNKWRVGVKRANEAPRPAAFQLAVTGPVRRTIYSQSYVVPLPETRPLRLYSASAWFEATPDGQLRELARWLPTGREDSFRPLRLGVDSVQWISQGYRLTLPVRGPRTGRLQLDTLTMGSKTMRRRDAQILEADPSGVVWCYSSFWRGCYQQRPVRRVVQPLQLADGQPAPSARGIGRLPDGRLIVGTYGGLFTQAADSAMAPLRPLPIRWRNSPNLPLAYDLLVTRNGHVLTAHEGYGFYLLDPKQNTMEPLVLDSADSTVAIGAARTLCQDRRGRFWGGTNSGLFRLDPARRRMTRVAIPPLDLTDITEDPATGALWLATTGGLYQFDPATRQVQRVGGPGSRHPLPTEALLCATAAEPGRVWVGTRNEGMLLVDRATGLVRQLTLADGLPSNIVATILRQPDGTLWAGTYAGLVRYQIAEARAIVFGEDAGFTDTELNRNSAFLDHRTGAVYLGGVDGVFRVNPHAVGPQAREFPPRLLLTTTLEAHNAEPATVHWLNTQTMPAMHLAAHPAAFVELRLALTRFADAALTRFAYRLRRAGRRAQTPWIVTSRRLVLNDIPAGDYVVEIRAETATGQRAANRLHVPLHVDRVWWQHPLTWGLAAVLLVALAYGLFWLQGRRARREARLREELAANLHDEVGTLLTKISLMAEMLQQPIAQAHGHAAEDDGLQPTAPGVVAAPRQLSVQLIASLLTNSRAAAQAMRDVVWSIDSRADSVSSLLDRMRDYLDQIATPADLTYEFTADPLARLQSLRPVVRKHLYLIFKEAVTNALRHAKTATTLHVRLVREGNTFVLEVADDGRNSGPVGRSGQGLRNMTARAQTLGGTLVAGPRTDGTPGFRVVLRVKG